MKSTTERAIEMTIFLLGIAGIIIFSITETTAIITITMACYGYMAGRLDTENKK